jgi:hypothetical protein
MHGRKRKIEKTITISYGGHHQEKDMQDPKEDARHKDVTFSYIAAIAVLHGWPPYLSEWTECQGGPCRMMTK